MWIDAFYWKGVNDRFYLSTNAGNWEGIQLEKYWCICVPRGLRVNDKAVELKGTYFILRVIYGVILF